MCRKAFDIYSRGLGETLRAKDVETLLAPIGIQPRRESIFLSRFVGGNERRGVLDRRGRSGQMCDPGLAAVMHGFPLRLDYERPPPSRDFSIEELARPVGGRAEILSIRPLRAMPPMKRGTRSAPASS